MNILARRRGSSNFIVDLIADHANAISNVYRYLEADLRSRPYVDQDDVDKIMATIAGARARLDRIETELASPSSRARRERPQVQSGGAVPGGIIHCGDPVSNEAGTAVSPAN